MHCIPACGLAACGIGINAVVSHMPDSQYPVLFIVSLVLGRPAGMSLDPGLLFQTLGKPALKVKFGTGVSAGYFLYRNWSIVYHGAGYECPSWRSHVSLYECHIGSITSMSASTYGIGMALAAPYCSAGRGFISLPRLLIR